MKSQKIMALLLALTLALLLALIAGAVAGWWLARRRGATPMAAGVAPHLLPDPALDAALNGMLPPTPPPP